MKYKLDTSRIKPKVKQSGLNKRGGVHFLRFFKNLFAVVLLGVVGVLIFPNDVPQRVEQSVDEMLIRLDLRVLNIMVIGVEKLPQDQVLEASKIEVGDNIFLVDLAEVKGRIENLTWVREATISRSLPNSIIIDVAEERPEAVFILGDVRYLISGSGKLLSKIDDDEQAQGYLYTKGKQANIGFREIVGFVQKHNVLYSQLEGVEKVSNRRWNLVLKTGCVVQLPETMIAEALEAFDRIQNQNKILSLPTVVDLRLAPDKIFLRFPKV